MAAPDSPPLLLDVVELPGYPNLRQRFRHDAALPLPVRESDIGIGNSTVPQNLSPRLTAQVNRRFGVFPQNQA
jgi:hypothetical protein